MEPTETKIVIHHVVYTTVEEIRSDIHSEGKHWWVHFTGSRESLAFQGEKPFEKGDKVKITFQKVEPDAQPSRPSIQ